VNYPGVGWMSYDPTHVIPMADGGAGQTFPGAAIFSKLASTLVGLIPQAARDAIGAGFGVLARAAQSAADSWPITVGLTALFVLAGTLLTRLGRRRRRGPPRVGAGAAFELVETTFAERGHPRASSITPTEYLRSLLRSDGLARMSEEDLRAVMTAFERERFAPLGATPDETAEALAAAARVRENAASPS